MKKNTLITIVILFMVFAVASLILIQKSDTPDTNNINKSSINNFQECADAGYPIMESYPRQCRTSDGDLFVEDIGNVIEKQDDIRINNPMPGDTVSSPLLVRGEARGYWFFEADFPIKVLDSSGNELGAGIAKAQGDWMTEDFVVFEASVEFSNSETKEGTLVLQKDNPSGLPENEDELIIPIEFSKSETTSRALDGCVIGGCSGEICSDKEMSSACVYKEEYACYKTATCEKQENGECGWTKTKELNQCLQSS
ncbi:MAG: Gmad2 immunoglobulin-like domain-containing protein [Candidatus Spechtbacterales bacterium]|nr:Gmad2 immunoglobulin-like domain-containing protein [Candidatus Spechtbacterales bacterium]